jgi:hypothetical protein
MARLQENHGAPFAPAGSPTNCRSRHYDQLARQIKVRSIASPDRCRRGVTATALRPVTGSAAQLLNAERHTTRSRRRRQERDRELLVRGDTG